MSYVTETKGCLWLSVVALLVVVLIAFAGCTPFHFVSDMELETPHESSAEPRTKEE